MDYRSIIESRYNRTRWQELLHDIFRHNVQFWQQPQQVAVDENVAKNALYTGKISLPDGHVIAIYEVELSDKVVIERNRAGIRNLLCTSWRGMGCTGAFMFCHRHEESVLRFSYVSESYAFAEDGSVKKESTDTKRFTYLLGEGHRSRTAIRQFEELKKSALDLKAITKAFSVEALSDIFFKEYKNHYENIIEYVTGKRMVKVANKWEEQETGKPCHEIMQEFSSFPDAEKAIRDYVKKLMGRLVFIQFLQKKGWMGCSAGEAWNDGDKEFVQNLFAKSDHKDTFVDDVLEPLFHDINTKRDGDITSSTNIGNDIKIPYLNGGLFEKDDYDNTAFPLPAKFIKELLDFFANYNFTIDENDPDDAEIGVDPEMLGRIFENLLEDNKDKGAFYTPKEIVHYMCRESLIAYLQTDIQDDAAKDAIRQFVTTYDATILTDDQKTKVDQKLKDVKICDPAIGSGAFPMGLLRELYACRKAIEGIDDETAVSIKTHIIQNNIYGVDIEKGAVDIARLRFWLALIVDEKTPHALPNMDFKIMQGNSLLEQYEGVELSGMSLNEQTQKKTKRGQAWQQSFAFDEQDSLNNIQNAIREYYNTDEHGRKVELRNIINSNVKSYIINLKGCTDDIRQKLEALPIPNDQFFLWHIYFKEVFDKGGFDIVIGNPPYLRIHGIRDVNPKQADLLTKTFKSATASFDLYVCFVELGLNIINGNGVANFIMPLKWSNAAFGKGLRELISQKEAAYKIINFGAYQVFNASTYTALQWFKPNTKELLYNELNRDLSTNSELGNYLNSLNSHDMSKISSNKLKKETWVLTAGDTNSILAKLDKQPRRAQDIFDKIFQGLATGKDDIYFIHDCIVQGDYIQGYSKAINETVLLESKLCRPLLKGEDVHRYDNISTKRYVVLPYSISSELLTEKELSTSFPKCFAYFKKCENTLRARERGRFDIDGVWFQLSRKQGLAFANKQKLIAPDISMGGNFTYDKDGKFYQTATIYGYVKKEQIPESYKSLMAILNSKLCWWFIQNTGVVMSGGFYRYKPAYINPFPMPSDEAILSVQNELEVLVDKILSIKQQNPQADTSALEAEIDQLVYKLYDLTPDEIAIIEKS